MLDKHFSPSIFGPIMQIGFQHWQCWLLDIFRLQHVAVKSSVFSLFPDRLRRKKDHRCRVTLLKCFHLCMFSSAMINRTTHIAESLERGLVQDLHDVASMPLYAKLSPKVPLVGRKHYQSKKKKRSPSILQMLSYNCPRSSATIVTWLTFWHQCLRTCRQDMQEGPRMT